MYLSYEHEFILSLFISETAQASYLKYDSDFNSTRYFDFSIKYHTLFLWPNYFTKFFQQNLTFHYLNGTS